MRVHFKVIEGSRQRIQVFEGIVHQAPGLGLPRDVHRPQAVVRRRGRAHVPAPLAEDREARGRGDRRRPAREALLLARKSGEEGARPRAPAGVASILGRVALSTGQRLLAYDRRLGVRYVAGADEAGRGSLAGPLVVAGVLLDYELLARPRVRRLALLNDSKQVRPEEREALFHAVVACATRISVRVVSVGRDRPRRPAPLEPLRRCGRCSRDLHPPADACLVDGFRLGPRRRRIARSSTATRGAPPSRPPRSSPRSLRDRVMRRLDAVYPRYGFVSHVGYITPEHSEAVRAFGPSEPAPPLLRGRLLRRRA